MKRPVIFTLLFFISMYATAQFGIKGGMNFSNLKYDDFVTDEYDISMVDNKKAGFHFGVFARASMFGLFLQPELYFSTSSNELNVEEIRTGETKIVEQKFNKLDIPVMVGGKFGPLRAGLGPVATLVINNKSELKDYTQYEEKFRNATFGYQLGVGLDISKISFDFRYEGNLSKFGDGITVAGEQRNFDGRERQFLLSLGLAF